MKKTGLLFAYLAAGLLLVILVLSLVFSLNPLHFFKEIQASKWQNITYLAMLYIMIFAAVHIRARSDGLGGISGIGLRAEKGKLWYIPFSAGITLISMSLYLFIMVRSGAACFQVSGNIFSLLVQGIFFGFLYALVEELLFRGYIFGTLIKERNPFIAYAFSGTLFAVLHLFRPGDLTFKIFYFIGLFALGSLLSYVYRISGSLWASIALHMTLIMSMYLMPSLIKINESVYNKTEFIWGAEKTPVAGIAAIIILIFIAGFMNKTKNRVGTDFELIS